MNGYAAQFAQIKQELFRERMNDIRDVILNIPTICPRGALCRLIPPVICAMGTVMATAPATATNR